MSRKMLIDATHPEETRVVVVDGNKVDDFDFESVNKRQLAGNIYLAKVMRVEPSLQAAFIDYGGNRHGFLAFDEIHPDYYQIPVADREALLADEEREARAEARADDHAAEGRSDNGRKRSRGGRGSSDGAGDGGDAEAAQTSGAGADAVAEPEASSEQANAPAQGSSERGSGRRRGGRRSGGRAQAGVDGLEVIDFDQTAEAGGPTEGGTPRGLEIAGEPEATVEAAQPVAAASEGASVDTDAPAVDTAVAPGSVAAPEPGPETGPDAPVATDSTEPATDNGAVDTADRQAPATAEAVETAPAQAVEATPEDVTEAGSAADAPAAPDAPETPAEPDTASDGPSDDPSDSPSRSMAESAGLEDETISEDIVEPAEETETQTATPDDAGAVSPPKRRRRSSRDKAARAEKSAEQTGEDPAGDGTPAREAQRGRRSRNSADDEDGGRDAPVESAGADDPREEVQVERVQRRRRYKIQDVIKVRQIMLVQVVKEERGNKGAALTTYLSLAGRYCVLMPNTARGGGISRKITNAPDRKRLRDIVEELEVPQGMGLIVRTAGAERTRPEIKRDYEFLIRQWEQVRELTLRSIAPTLIYEEGSLIKRSIRDLYTKDIEEILVEGDAGYREAKDYMKMLMPSHARHVQQYADAVPLFIKYQVESYLNAMFSPVVQLKSGGYIVIGITEALVAIDVNSGRSTKESSIEDTALKTNLEASDEVARQLRLRDLAGLIVIDYIDMDESRNDRAVEKRLKDRLKSDRARIQFGRISPFGLLEMSRQRLRPGMIEATTRPCAHCHGTGTIRSDESLALAILREVEEEAVRSRSAEVTVTAPVEIANYLINQKRGHVMRIEQRHGLIVTVFGDPRLVSPNYTVDRSKTAIREVDHVPAAITAESAMTGRAEAVEAPRAEQPRHAPRPAEARQPEARGSEQAPPPRTTAVSEAPETKSAVTAGSGDADDATETDEARQRRRRGKRGGRRRRGRGGDDRDEGETGAVSTAQAQAPETDEAALEAEQQDAGAAVSPTAPNPSETGEETAGKPAEAAAESAEADTADAPVAEKPKRARSPRRPRGRKAAEAAVEDSAPEGGSETGAPDTGPAAEAGQVAVTEDAATAVAAQTPAAPSAPKSAEATVPEVAASPVETPSADGEAHEAAPQPGETVTLAAEPAVPPAMPEPARPTEVQASEPAVAETVPVTVPEAAMGTDTPDAPGTEAEAEAPAAQADAEAPAAQPKAEPETEATDTPAQSKRRGWWSFNR